MTNSSSKLEPRRLLRYCYRDPDLYEDLRDHTSRFTNVCKVLFYDSDCRSIERKYTDGVEYADDVRVSFFRTEN